MKKKTLLFLWGSLFVLLAGFPWGCTEEERDLYGSISGLVTDGETNAFVSGVSVALSPLGVTKVTGSDGSFAFNELAPADYTLTFSKDGYITDTRTVTAQAGVDTKADKSLMPLHPQIGVSKTDLDFGVETTTLSFDIQNTGNGTLEWAIAENADWLTCSPVSGKTEKEVSPVTVTVSREGLKRGSYSQKLALTSNGGSVDINVTLEVDGSNLGISPSEIDLGETETAIQLTLTNNGKGTLEYKAEVSNEWMNLSKTAGKVTEKDYITLTVNRSALAAGEYKGQITFTVGEEVIVIPVQLTVPVKSTPVVSLDAVKNTAYNGATLSGTIVSVGYSKINRYGFCWSDQEEEPVIGENNFTDMGDCSKPMTVEGAITGLKAETKYFVRLYAENNEGRVYSNTLSFTTTKLPVLPTVQTGEVIEVESNTATASGKVTHLGYVTSIAQHGHIWGETQELTTALKTKTELGTLNAPADFTSKLTGLSANRTYYICAYAVNEKGTAYGEIMSFKTTTGGMQAPTLAKVTVAGVDTQGATLQCSVTDDGKSAVTGCGFCWNTSPEPTVDNESVACDPSNPTFGTKLSGLKDNTLYYARAYATNEIGTSYSETVEFTTKAVTLPEWGTITVSNITRSQARVSGTLTSDGNSPVTEMGVCWSTHPESTPYDEKQVCPTGTGLNIQVSGLQPETTYYLRAYAQNSKGIAYSNEVPFTTLSGDTDIWDGVSVAEKFGGGSGTESDPILITEAAQLKLLADKVNSGTTYAGIYFKLMVNIDLNNRPWTPIGSDKVFSGNFNGNGKSITSLYISYSQSNVGLFGNAANASFSNLKVSGRIQAKYNYAGMLCGYASESIQCDRIETSGTIQGTNAIGGICGGAKQYKIVSIANSINRVNIEGIKWLGGFFGGMENYSGSCTIINSLNYGNVTGSERIGGFIGKCGDAKLTNCVSHANVKVGYGIVERTSAGYATYYCWANNCFWLNDIANNTGVEKGFGIDKFQEKNNCDYFIPNTNNCILPNLEEKDLIEILNEWVNFNGAETYRRWTYKKDDNGKAYPALEEVQ